MTSKTFKIAELAALLAARTNHSAYTCADLAVKLHQISDKQVRQATFACNGYKNEWQNLQLNKLSRINPNEANTYAERIQTEGAAWCAKQTKAIDKALAKIKAEHGLHVRTASLSGLIWTMGALDDMREFYI